MRKVLLIASALLGLTLFSSKANAQTNSFPKDVNVVTMSIGSMSTFNFSALPPLAVTYERNIIPNITKNDNPIALGVGGQVQVYGTGDAMSTFLGVRGALHYQFVDNLDTYAGLQLGTSVLKVSGVSPAFRYGYSIFLGARYYFNENWGVSAETGYGLATISLGASYKF